MDVLEKAVSEGDPRTENWLMVKSPTPVLALIIAYLYIVRKGPKFMENYKPLPLRNVLILYNFIMVCISAYMFKEVVVTSYLSNYSYKCQMVDYSSDPLALRMANVVWWFFFTKAIEFLDTIFFILRKKTGQITFLHVYHHCTMLSVWWIGAKYVAGGQAFFPVMINSFVHVVMYTYYGLSILGDWIRPYLWWKRYLTQMQLIQFASIVVHVCVGLYNKCAFPNWMFYTGVFYVVTLTILFLNYYIQTYIKKKMHPEVDATKLKQQ